MTDGALCAAEGDFGRLLPPLFPEHESLDRLVFCGVPQRGRGRVGVDVVDGGRGELSLPQSFLHREKGSPPVFSGCSEVVGVCRVAITHEFGVDPGTSGFGMFEFLWDTEKKGEDHVSGQW